MKEQQPKINLRSEEVQEILTRPPHWMIRWGIGAILLLLVFLIGLSWAIQYPDVVEGRITLTTETPPAKLVSKTSGQLDQLFFKEGDTVRKGDLIAEVISPVQPSTIEYLKIICQAIGERLQGTGSISPVTFSDSTFVLGAIQTDYHMLQDSFREYRRLQDDSFRAQDKELIRAQIRHHEELKQINQRQLTHNLTLKEKENLRKEGVQNEIAITSFEQELLEIERTNSERGLELRDALEVQLNNIKNFTDSWQQNFVLIAPMDGAIGFVQNLSQGQSIEANKPLLAIMPMENILIGQVEIPSSGFGKVEKGQVVQIQLDNYPHHEFGQVLGSITQTKMLPSANLESKEMLYQGEVSLTNGLNSTYGQKLTYLPEMGGMARIITEDLRLIDRIFSQFRSVLDRE